MILEGCQANNYAPVEDLYRSQSPVTQGFHEVKPGETLFSIAWRYNRDYRQLAKNNGIKPPYKIMPGQRINLQKSTKNTQSVAVGKQTVSSANQTQRYKKEENQKKPVLEKVANQRHNAVNIVWQWPATGSVLNHFSTKGKVNKGINIAGQRGAPVFAAASGKVVYSGPGMVGYGNLIILKHNEDFLSAYAHNSKLLVKEGDVAKVGQKIAEIGSSGVSNTQLHFEIRLNGRPVNPLRYLPKR